MKVLVPVLRCPECGTSYALEVNLLGGPDGPEWIYVRDRSCRRHPMARLGEVPADELELAALTAVREVPA